MERRGFASTTIDSIKSLEDSLNTLGGARFCRTETKGQEVSAVPGGDPVPGPIASAAGIGADPAKCQQRYCTAHKELLAVVQALKHFKCYLYGQKITVRTDNSAVSWLHRSKDPVGQPARWIEVIDTYDITFQHRPGRKHRNADALSSGTSADSAEETVQGSQPRECGRGPGVRDASQVGPQKRWLQGRTPIPISAPS